MVGYNLVAGEYITGTGNVFRGIDPSNGAQLEGEIYAADEQLADQAMIAANAAFKAYKTISGKQKAAFLRTIADDLTAAKEALTKRATKESGLPAGRINGEIDRTAGQLKMFAGLVEEGSWVEAVIDNANPARQPLPKPGIRKMLVPMGPVVVFGASNFPLAFSVAGGDTASALAAGCPVVVKAHPAHPGTSAMVAEIIHLAVAKCGMPKGTFSILYDTGYAVGAALVKHKYTKAVAFTGSFKGGMALVSLAQQRPDPIPVFAEMGSINPIVVLPNIIAKQGTQLAQRLAASITLGAGQFCTNPGLILGVNSPDFQNFVEALGAAVESSAKATMLTSGIWQNYAARSEKMLQDDAVELIGRSQAEENEFINQAIPAIAKITAKEFLKDDKYREEIFGPWSLVVIAENKEELQSLVGAIDGQLTATVMAEENELAEYTSIIQMLQEKVGRLIFNGLPTGVEVTAAMQHGGPFPATNDSRFTSVGTGAIRRFVRPLAWQDWPDSLLPDELKDGNPLNIYRLVDGNWTRNLNEQ